MQKDQIYKIMNENPVFWFSTVDGDAPRVRGMLLYRADQNGIIFHTGTMKPVYQQIVKNKNTELCFYAAQQNLQIRVRGTLEIVKHNDLIDEITSHPSRAFLKGWKDSCTAEEFYASFIVLRLKKATARLWTMETNLEESEAVLLD